MEILNVVKEMLTSKKFIAAVVGVIIAAANEIGLDLPQDALVSVVGVIVAYILAQGWADTGKEAEKVKAGK